MDDAPLAAAPVRKKTSRIGKPKVRSGCISCKQRRVKCDERKPQCLRCETFGCPCEGYEFQRRKVINAVPKYRLFPKPTRPNLLTDRTAATLRHRQTELSASRNGNEMKVHPFDSVTDRANITFNCDPPHVKFYNTALSDQLVIYSPSASVLETAQEEQYFRYYKQVFDTGTWTSLFLQASHEEPFVLHAIIAIGALSRALEACLPNEPSVQGKCVKTLPNFNDASIKNSHHKFALQKYGKSIRRMRDIFSEGKENIRFLLLSCFLTTCFESLHGRHERALVQMQSGLQVMYEWVKKQPKDESRAGLQSPAPHVIEDSLFRTFERLDMTAIPFFDKRSAQFHRARSLERADIVKFMPKFFTDIQEAGNYIAVISIRIVHFVKYMELSFSGSRNKKQTMHSDKDMETLLLNKHVPLPDDTLNEIEAYSQEIVRWLTAFEPLMKQVCLSGNENAYLRVMFLYLCAKHETVLCKGLRCIQECDFEEFLPEFTEIVTLAETIISHPNFSHLVGRPIFSFDISFVFPLMVIGLKCRDWNVRRRAVDLLRNNPRREGIWDSSLAAGIILWIMALEEESLEYGAYIPEQKRARLSMAKQDFTKRTAYLSAMQTTLDGRVIWRETVIDW